jgi:hypothetical protein
MDIHVIITCIMGTIPTIACYNINSTMGFIAMGITWLVCQCMLATRYLSEPHKSRADFLFNQIPVALILGLALLLCYYIVGSEEVDMIKLWRFHKYGYREPSLP